MANQDALWNEVTRLINEEFVKKGELLTPVLLKQMIKAINEMLTEDDASA